MKYRKKPVVVEAFQITEETRNSNCDWPDWMHRAWQKEDNETGALYPWRDIQYADLAIVTLEGIQRVSMNDYIIQGEEGEIYPCKPDIFEMTYESVNEQKRLEAIAIKQREAHEQDLREGLREDLREGLTREEISYGFRINDADLDAESYWAGVIFAEKMHGIGGGE